MMPDDPQVMSYLAVRRALGLLGLALPVGLYAYARLFGYGMQPSISEFYHTHMGDVLVGSLVAIGVFLIAYKGYPRQPGEAFSDRWVATIAGLGAIGVAIFSVVPPTLTECPAEGIYPPEGTPIQGAVKHWCSFAWIHFASAAVFFICLAVFCFRLFPRGDTNPDGSIDWSTAKNRIYFVCGVAILVSIAALLVYALVGVGAKEALRRFHYVFWWETVGVIAFAISWLTKGKIVQAVTGSGQT